MDRRICIIYNYAQHYRLGVFKRLDEELPVDFYFGDKMADVKKLDYSELKGYKGELKNIKLFKNFYWQSGVLRIFFKDYRQFIMLGEYYCLSTWLLLFMSIFSSKKVYLWTHGWYGKENKGISLIKKFFFSMADGIFLYGDYAKQLMIKEGIRKDKLHVIYNSLNYTEQKIHRENLVKSDLYENYFGNSNPVLIFIGRLTKIKKLHYIIEAQKSLFSLNMPVNLAIIGDGEERSFLENSVKENGLTDYVWFVGKLYDEKLISKYIYNADLCVSPGNVGLTAIHSLMYGTPVITHGNFALQMPEFEAIVKGETGDFFDYNDIDSLSISIENWLRNCNSRGDVRDKCFKMIDSKFNPEFQILEISKIIHNGR